MASSSGRDGKPNSNTSPPEAENPFIRFKNFADAQASAFLQGIIGLPSAFSKRAPGDNQWAEIDEDLRRRDQLQARQQMLREQTRETEDPKADGNSARTEVEIPVKKSNRSQETHAASQPNSFWKSSGGGANTADRSSKNDPNLIADLPLYSPVTRDLFSNLTRPNTLLMLNILELFEDISFNDLSGSGSSSILLRRTQQLAFNHLRTMPAYRSDYSLLPYLLFSPYSPLKLDAESTLTDPNVGKIDSPRYCAAFEDLIRTTQGKKILPIARSNGPFTSGIKINLSSNWDWICNLYDEGILQQKRSALVPLPASEVWKDLPVQEGGPSTELDHLEQVLSKAANHLTSSDSFFHAMFNALQSPYEEPIREGAEGSSLHDMISQARERALAEAQQIQSTHAPKEQNLQDIDRRPTKNILSPDRVVSASTTTERITHEDGTVETCVTIWKRFDDGRETTTTTTHTEDPGWDDKEQPSWPAEAVSKETGEGTEQKDEKKEQKKGWFWN